MRSWIIAWALLLVAVAPSWAQANVTINAKQIEKWGAHVRTFTPLTFVDDEKLLIGLDEPPFTIKRKGIMHRVWLVKFDTALKVETFKSYDLRLANVEQSKLTPDHKYLVLVSKRGSQVDALRLSDGQLTNICSHVKGQPGFRVSPTLVFACGNKFYALGYPYDGDNVVGNSSIAEVDVLKSGAAAFQPVIDLDKLQDGVQNTTMRSMLSPDGVFFVSGGDEAQVTRWTPSGGYQPFDKGKRYTGSWGAQEFIVYGMARLDGGYEVVVGNARTGEKKVVASGEKIYINPVLGHEGNTWTALMEEGNNKYTLLAGTDKDASPRKLREHFGPCVLRVGTLGETVVSFGLTGDLTIFKMP